MAFIMFRCSEKLKDDFSKYCANKYQSQAAMARLAIEKLLKEERDER